MSTVKNASNIRLRLAESFCDFRLRSSANVMEKQRLTPFFRHVTKEFPHELLYFPGLYYLLRRGHFNVGHDIFNLQVFIGLVEIEDLVTQCGYFHCWRCLRNVFFDVDCTLAILFSNRDFGIEYIHGNSYQPASDVLRRIAFEKLPIRPNQRAIHDIFGLQFPTSEFACSFGVMNHMAHKMI